MGSPRTPGQSTDASERVVRLRYSQEIDERFIALRNKKDLNVGSRGSLFAVPRKFTAIGDRHA
jgi:hypothetical protein